MTAVTSSYMTSIDNAFPVVTRRFIHLFCRIHQIWKRVRYVQELTESATNLGFGIAGYLIEHCLGHLPFVTIPARGLFLARKVIDCVKAQKLLISHFHAYKRAWTEPIERPGEWLFSNKGWHVKLKINALIERTFIIFSRIHIFFCQLFQVSMTCISVIEAFSTKKEITSEAVTTMCLNLKSVINDLRGHQIEVYNTLESFATRCNASFFISALKKVLQFHLEHPAIPEAHKEIRVLLHKKAPTPYHR